MIRRVFWTGLGVGLGAATGVLVARRVRRAQEALTPGNVGGALLGAVSGMGGGVRAFFDDVRDAMGEREAELAEGLGLTAPSDDVGGP